MTRTRLGPAGPSAPRNWNFVFHPLGRRRSPQDRPKTHQDCPKTPYNKSLHTKRREKNRCLVWAPCACTTGSPGSVLVSPPGVPRLPRGSTNFYVAMRFRTTGLFSSTSWSSKDPSFARFVVSCSLMFVVCCFCCLLFFVVCCFV